MSNSKKLVSVLLGLVLSFSNAFGYRLTKISDGDTVTVLDDKGKKISVRMVDIDTPELHLAVKGGVVSQGHWAEEAKEYLESLIPLNAEVDLDVIGKDKYQRTLAKIFYKGRDIHLAMIESGHAAPYFYCTGSECKKDFITTHQVAKYSAACRKARSQGKGIFSFSDPLEEMPFEFRLRMAGDEPNKFVGNYKTKKTVQPDQYGSIDLCDRVFFQTESDIKKLGFALPLNRMF